MASTSLNTLPVGARETSGLYETSLRLMALTWYQRHMVWYQSLNHLMPTARMLAIQAGSIAHPCTLHT